MSMLVTTSLYDYHHLPNLHVEDGRSIETACLNSERRGK